MLLTKMMSILNKSDSETSERHWAWHLVSNKAAFVIEPGAFKRAFPVRNITFQIDIGLLQRHNEAQFGDVT
ncbi:hypothetical protein Y032_0152g2849 [Ancylostoma ceylanicum]|uniref:Uncharacterized protein n=1 Tax=Ancylostoma ceylanicum TaxID=53326 RepID=A0A016SZM2_9BILA|nr:hypothetical protein Y032_0152g2849 [Ancylostoma ceylanicum]